MIEVKVNKHGDARGFLSKLARKLTGRMESAIGFPAGKSGSAIVMRAVWNEFGTSRGIPERPFMRQGIKRYSNGEFRPDAAKAMKGIVLGRAGTRAYLEKMSIVIVGKIQQSITSGGWVANTPATIKAKTVNGKKGTTPLIDTGEMRQSVTYEVR